MAKLLCFVIAPIGEKDSETRKRSDKVLKHIFKKALSDKYDIKRADEITEPGMITSQVLRAVQDADLVVADLTLHNPNVFYELAVRHAIEKPIIHVIEPSRSKIPFDVSGFRTIEFELTDPDSIESAVAELTTQADNAQSGKWGETPIKLAQIMRRTKEDSTELLLLKQAVEGISNVAAKITRLESLAPPTYTLGYSNVGKPVAYSALTLGKDPAEVANSLMQSPVVSNSLSRFLTPPEGSTSRQISARKRRGQ